MPVVPPQEHNPESEQPAEAANSPSPSEVRPGGPSPIDAVLIPPSGPLGPADEERSDTTPAPDALPSEVAAGPTDEQYSHQNAPEAQLPEGAAPAAYRPDVSPVPAVTVPHEDAIAVTTTGVPHYAPPAAAPAFPRGPGVEVAPGGSGSGEATAAAPPIERRSIVRSFARGLREVAETVILALLIFLLVRAVVQNFQVEGSSMQPTLQTRWYLLVNKALYWEINLNTINKFLPFIDPGEDPTRYVFRGPRRGDIIVFKAPNQSRGSPERDFIKRIIGLPGETVEVRDCTVFINGGPLDEPYALYVDNRPTSPFGPETVPPGHLFVLGDNRNNSSDSRSWGMLLKENIIGQAWLTYWPFSVFGLVDNTSAEPGSGVAQETTVESAASKPAPACS